MYEALPGSPLIQLITSYESCGIRDIQGTISIWSGLFLQGAHTDVRIKLGYAS